MSEFIGMGCAGKTESEEKRSQFLQRTLSVSTAVITACYFISCKYCGKESKTVKHSEILYIRCMSAYTLLFLNGGW